ncbi:uracil-DNA glycosylase [bacterium]|jgi:uracil-DNA glycosylase|nr:uracil-DNA glycosylase [bacterium]
MQEEKQATTWREVLHGERQKRYFADLIAFVENERASGKAIYPSNADVFRALSLTEFEEVKIVILGQDPYHGPKQAHGLCFSVPDGIAFPPSLENLFKELKADIGMERPSSGCLKGWAQQGVLLLNSVLTVEAGQAGSHANRGWERFTDRIIAELNERRDGLVFLLWGAYAQKKGSMIDGDRHTVLAAPHPSPLSAHRGFFGCQHFSKANAALEQYGVAAIDWEVGSMDG